MTRAKRYNTSKTAHSLVPTEILEGLARVYMMGVEKYGRDNWRSGQGLSWCETWDAAQRHMQKWLAGEKIDPESGLSHALHASWNMLTLFYYESLGEEFKMRDDRFATMTNVLKRNAGSPNVGMDAQIPDLPPAIFMPGGIREHLKNMFNGDIKHGGPDITTLQKEIAAWADSVFPHRTARGALIKLVLEEIPELLQSGHCVPEEFADVVILVLDIAHLQGIDIGAAVRAKMEVNRKRTWKVDPETGLMNHVEQPDFIPKEPLE